MPARKLQECHGLVSWPQEWLQASKGMPEQEWAAAELQEWVWVAVKPQEKLQVVSEPQEAKVGGLAK